MLVDDHPLIRTGLRVLIERGDGYEVCAEAGDSPQALAMLRQHQPDMAVVDVTLHSANGIELTKSLCVEKPDLKVLVLSSHPEELYAERAVRAGARGYLMKDVMADDILTALDQVRQGAIYVSPALKEKILHRFVSGTSEQALPSVEQLTDREIEIFELIGEGLSVWAIASRLHLSVKTISSYREHLKAKLALDSGAELLRFAIQWMKNREALPEPGGAH